MNEEQHIELAQKLSYELRLKFLDEVIKVREQGGVRVGSNAHARGRGRRDGNRATTACDAPVHPFADREGRYRCCGFYDRAGRNQESDGGAWMKGILIGAFAVLTLIALSLLLGWIQALCMMGEFDDDE